MEFEEYDLPEDESGIIAEIEYTPAELVVYTEIAFKTLEPLLTKYGHDFCWVPMPDMWDEFYEKFRDEFIKERPDLFHFFRLVRKEHWQAIGLNAYALKKLQDNRERRNWQYEIWGTQQRPVDMFTTVLIERFPDLIKDLDTTVSPYFFNYKNLLEETDTAQERHELWDTLSNELEQSFIIEKNDSRAKYNYHKEFSAKVSTEVDERMREKETKGKSEAELLLKEYRSQLKQWFCKHSLCDENQEILAEIFVTAHEWIRDSYQLRSIDATTQITSWCSTRGTNTLLDYLTLSDKKPGFWAWPGTNSSITFIYFKPENFEFKFPAWLPTIPPFPSEQIYEEALRKTFEKQLTEYLNKISSEYKTHKLNTKASTATLELQIEWLIKRNAFNEAYKNLAVSYKKSQSTIKEGITNAANLLKIKAK